MSGIIVFVSTIYLLKLISTLPRIDGQSSTDGIFFVFGFIVAMLIGTISFFLGQFLKEKFELLLNGSTKGSLLSVVLIFGIFSFVLGIIVFGNTKKSKTNWDEINALGVKYDNNIVEKINVDSTNLNT